ncbi:hypothetical protein Emag_007139 [Eimeria magna]
MVGTRRTDCSSASVQSPRRAVGRATPPRTKRSRSIPSTSATRDAAGVPTLTRACLALLTITAKLETPRRAPLLGIFDRLPRLNTVPRNYAYLRALLHAVGLAVQALDRPANTFRINMQQLPPHLQAHIRTGRTAQLDPTRPVYEHMVAILIQQVAPGKPKGYLHRRSPSSLAAPIPSSRASHFPKGIGRDTRNQASAANRLNDLHCVAHLAITFHTLARTYPGKGEHRSQNDNTLTLNGDFHAPPASAEQAPSAPSAAPRAQASPPVRRQQRTAPPPSKLSEVPPPATWAASPHHLNQQAPRATLPPTLPNAPAGQSRAPAPSAGQCFSSNAPDRGHRTRQSYLVACLHDPTLASKCPSCRAPGFCPPSCLRRQQFVRGTRLPHLEVDRFGRSHYIRADLPSPARSHPDSCAPSWLQAPPQGAQPPQSVALVQHHPAVTHTAPQVPAKGGQIPLPAEPANTVVHCCDFVDSLSCYLY